VLLSSPGLQVAVGSNARSVHGLALDPPGGAVRALVDFPEVHRGSVYALDWLQEDRLLASGSNDKLLKILQ